MPHSPKEVLKPDLIKRKDVKVTTKKHIPGGVDENEAFLSRVLCALMVNLPEGGDGEVKSEEGTENSSLSAREST